MRKTYIYVNGELVEKGSDEHYNSLGPMVMPDIQPYKSMIDGSMITSRSVHRDHLRQHNCIEIGNEKMESKPPPVIDTRREVMRQQLANMTHKQANQILSQLRRKFT
jgi:ribosomal protein S1